MATVCITDDEFIIELRKALRQHLNIIRCEIPIVNGDFHPLFELELLPDSQEINIHFTVSNMSIWLSEEESRVLEGPEKGIEYECWSMTALGSEERYLATFFSDLMENAEDLAEIVVKVLWLAHKVRIGGDIGNIYRIPRKAAHIRN